VTHLRKVMLEELQRRNYSNGTIRHHLRVVQEFARHFATAPDKLGLNELRSYQAYLLKTRKLAVGTVVNHLSALRFFFVRTLKRNEFETSFHIRTSRSAKDPGYWTGLLSVSVCGRLVPSARAIATISTTPLLMSNPGSIC
jgi:hypothetical protein